MDGCSINRTLREDIASRETFARLDSARDMHVSPRVYDLEVMLMAAVLRAREDDVLLSGSVRGIRRVLSHEDVRTDVS